MSDTNRGCCLNAAEEHDMLQFMRGFAILLVVFQHSAILYFDADF